MVPGVAAVGLCAVGLADGDATAGVSGTAAGDEHPMITTSANMAPDLPALTMWPTPALQLIPLLATATRPVSVVMHLA